MSVLLEHDKQRSVQSHLDELTWRTTLVFASIALLTVVWSFTVDAFLEKVLNTLKPCVGDCLNVYDPAQWSAVRWLTCLLLGIFSAIPLILFQVLQFSKPGLLPSEYRAFNRWLILTTLVLIAGTFFLIQEGLPHLYRIGFEQHQLAGLAPQYSAVDMLLVAAYCIWAFLVVIATWNAIAMMGAFGVLNAETADYWRLRLYGIGSLLLMLSIPEHAASMLLPLLATYWTSSELIGHRWFTKTLAVHGAASVRLDSEGRRRRVAMADCSCEGANTHYGHAQVEGCSTVDVVSLCTNSDSRSKLLEHVIQSRITDVVITGCDGSPCSSAFHANMNRLEVAVHGLNLMSLQNIRVLSPHPELDVQSAFVTIPSLFPPEVSETLLLNLIEGKNWLSEDDHIVRTDDTPTWGLYRSANDIVIPACRTTGL